MSTTIPLVLRVQAGFPKMSSGEGHDGEDGSLDEGVARSGQSTGSEALVRSMSNEARGAKGTKPPSERG